MSIKDDKHRFSFGESIGVLIPKKAVLREIKSKDGVDLAVIKLQGHKYRGYEFIYPIEFLHESKFSDDYYFTYMWPNKTVTINKRRLNTDNGEFENIESVNVTPELLRKIYMPKNRSQNFKHERSLEK